jgi:hypothetical protein
MHGFSHKHETKSDAALAAAVQHLPDGTTESGVIIWLSDRQSQPTCTIKVWGPLATKRRAKC